MRIKDVVNASTRERKRDGKKKKECKIGKWRERERKEGREKMREYVETRSIQTLPTSQEF